MASLIAGHGHDGGGSGIIGMAPEAKVLSIRVITDPGDPGYRKYQHEPTSRVQRSLAEAIRYAVRHRVDVINMSVGYGEASRLVRSALQYAFDHNVVVLASAGNSGAPPAAAARPLLVPGRLPGRDLGRGGGPAGAPRGSPATTCRCNSRRPGWGARGGPRRAVLAGQRDQPGLRAHRRRGGPDQVRLPAAVGPAGRDGPDHHHQEPAARRVRPRCRVRDGGRGRGPGQGAPAQCPAARRGTGGRSCTSVAGRPRYPLLPPSSAGRARSSASSCLRSVVWTYATNQATGT